MGREPGKTTKMRHTTFALLARTICLAMALFSLVSLLMVSYVHWNTQYVHDDVNSPEVDRTQRTELLTLESFVMFLSDSKSTSVNLTLSSNSEFGDIDRKLVKTFSHSMTVDVEFLNTFLPLFKQQLKMQSAPTLPSALLAEPVINDHRFFYVHNPHRACEDMQIEVLITVPSGAKNFRHRWKVRNEIIGKYVGVFASKAKLLFFLGRPSQSEDYWQIQQRINEEANMFGDIVQENFEDIYKNMRYKAVSMLKWASMFCSQTKYVIRSDDDVRINVTKLLSVLHRTHQQFGDFIIGRRKLRDRPNRDNSSKYFLSKKEYPESTFPPYALGGVLGYPINTVRLLYQAALRVKPIWLDDAFITGICAKKVKVPVLQDIEFNFRHHQW